MGKNGTVISILKVYNDRRCYFCFDLKTTEVEKSPIDPVVSLNSTRKAVPDKREYGTHVDSEDSRCDNASQLHPCTDGDRLCFIPVVEDSCCHLVAQKFKNCDEVARAIEFGQNFPESFTVDGVRGISQVNKTLAKNPACFIPDISLELAGPQRLCPWFLEIS